MKACTLTAIALVGSALAAQPIWFDESHISIGTCNSSTWVAGLLKRGRFPL
jgi:hypothetical protein